MSEESDITIGLPRTDEARDLRGAVNAALEISVRRRDILGRLRDALLTDDTGTALSLARQLCGIEDKKPDA